MDDFKNIKNGLILPSIGYADQPKTDDLVYQCLVFFTHCLLVYSLRNGLCHIVNHFVCHARIYTYPERIVHNTVCVV